MLRRSGSGGGDRGVASSELGPEQCVWWESRLLPYRHTVLFLWSALAFTPSVLPGAVLWLVAHVLLSSLLRLSGSLLEVCGNLLVMLAILYALLQLGLRYGNLSSSQSRGGQGGSREDQAFKELCTQVALSSHVIGAAVNNTLHSRVHLPSKFYGVGFVLSFLLYYIGQWLSTGVCLHLVLCGLLLVPLALDCHSPQHELLRDKLLRGRAELATLITHLLAKLKQSLNRTKTATR